MLRDERAGVPVEVGLLRFEPSTGDVTVGQPGETATPPRTNPAGVALLPEGGAAGAANSRPAGARAGSQVGTTQAGNAPDTVPAGISRQDVRAAAAARAAGSGRASGSTAPVEAPAGVPRHDLPVLDAYRGLAALMVVVTHVAFAAGPGVIGPWAGWLSRLDFGVTLFFLISGFLLFRPYVGAAYGLRPPVRVGAYLRRRCVRIYPAFLLAVAGVYVLLPRARAQEDEVWVQTIFLVRNYFSQFGDQLFGLMQTWSLVVEVSFYLALPLIARLVLGPGTAMADAVATSADTTRTPEPRRRLDLLRRLRPYRPAIVLAVLFVCSVVWQVGELHWDGEGTTRLWLPTYLDWFAAGMALAWLRERSAAVPVQVRYLADAPGVCLCLALAGYWLTTTRLGGPYDLSMPTNAQTMLKHLMFAGVATLLLLPAVFGTPRARWRRYAVSPVMRWLGDISFGVFLWHVAVIELIREHLGYEPWRGGFWVTFVLTLIVSVAIGTLSWRYVEEPLQRRFRHGFRASSRPVQPPRQPETRRGRRQARRA